MSGSSCALSTFILLQGLIDRHLPLSMSFILDPWICNCGHNRIRFEVNICEGVRWPSPRYVEFTRRFSPTASLSRTTISLSAQSTCIRNTYSWTKYIWTERWLGPTDNPLHTWSNARTRLEFSVYISKVQSYCEARYRLRISLRPCLHERGALDGAMEVHCTRDGCRNIGFRTKIS